MAINLKAPDFTEVKPRILVVGVGGAGGNAVNNMVASQLEGVEFIVANTDAQALAHSKAQRRVQIGSKLTSGLGAGSRPEIGTAAAEESVEEIKDCLAGSHMAFITAGMGGGTGTGGAPIIARIARELGVLTVGVVTKPFAFEGQRRMRIAEDGIHKLQEFVDTLIVIPNQNLFRVANEKTTFAKAFEIADDVLYSGVRGITDLMVMPGLINLDFGDVRTVMSEMGKAMMGTGEASGERRAIEAAEAAISNPLLDHSSMKGAKGVLINITGGMDLTLFEVDEAANKIRAEVDPEANIIVGSTFDEKLDGSMRVSVVATGISSEVKAQVTPKATSQAQAEAPRIVRPGAAFSATESKVEIRRAVEAPTPIMPQEAKIEVPNPVHALQSEIMLAGLAADQEAMATPPIDAAPSAPATMEGKAGAYLKPSQLAAAMRGHAESHDFDSGMIDALGPDPREAARQRIAAHMRPGLRMDPERKPKKRGGFNILGINIGGRSEPAAAERKPRSSSAASSLRLPVESPSLESNEARVLPATARSKVAAEEVRTTLASEDQLEIPAFLRRQAN
ncbi:MAG: cell division protein FtsZ [Alphaproteobacteria bacterium]|nr:cell division protein FtsZ [Alphaproteobacteria bacterium]